MAQSLALVAALCFGLALVMAGFGLRHMTPMAGAAVSVPTTALVLLVLSPWLVDWQGFDPSAAALFAAIGCLFPAAVTVLTFQANRRIGPYLTGALGNLAPVFAVLFAALLLAEAPAPLQAVGIFVVVIGATLLLAGNRSGATIRPGWIIALPLLAAVIRGLVQPAVKLGLAVWPDPYAAAMIGYLVSATLLGLAVIARSSLGAKAGNPVGRLWFACVGLCNGAAVLTLYAALARGPVAVVAPLVATYPLATLMFGALLPQGVRMTVRLGIGVAVTVAGVAILLVG